MPSQNSGLIRNRSNQNYDQSLTQGLFRTSTSCEGLVWRQSWIFSYVPIRFKDASTLVQSESGILTFTLFSSMIFYLIPKHIRVMIIIIIHHQICHFKIQEFPKNKINFLSQNSLNFIFLNFEIISNVNLEPNQNWKMNQPIKSMHGKLEQLWANDGWYWTNKYQGSADS